MDAQQATRSFKQAEALYSSGRHAEALEILENLDLNFPNTKNIIFPKALCLAALSRNEEAAAACDALDALQDPRAQSVREKLAPPSAGDDDDMMALDMDLLGDFDKPAPKRTAPAKAQAPSRKPMLLGIGAAVLAVALIGGVVYSGALGGLFAEKETVESAFAKIDEASSGLGSLTAYVSAEMNMKQPMPMSITMSGDIDYLNHNAQDLFLMNMVISMADLGMSQSIKMVSDGETMYQEMNVMGQVMVMKMDAGAVDAQDMNPTQLLDAIRKAGEISLLKDETFGGKPAYAFAVKPTSQPDLMLGLPKLDDIKVLVSKESGIPVLAEAKDASGETIFKASLSGVMTDMPSSPDKFKYTPPANVEVMDMSDMQGMMPFGMPGM